MLIRLVPPGTESGTWINTDHIVKVRELRGREVDDEPLALTIWLNTGEQIPVDVGRAGRGMAERIFAWLKEQEKLPVVEIPKPLAERVRKQEPVGAGK